MPTVPTMQTAAPSRAGDRTPRSADRLDLVAKRLLDVSCAGIGLTVLAPLLLGIALCIKLGDGGPVFYRASRIGLGNVPFRMCKFRTMIVGADRIGGTSTADTDRRITRVGKVLRRYKLDEVPQLMNVLAGQMSLVGPRPEVEEYTRLYSLEEQAILSVKPGMTDFASVRFFHLNRILAKSSDPDAYYRDVIRPQKNALRLDYALTRSFWMDIHIILRTVALVLGRRRDGA